VSVLPAGANRVASLNYRYDKYYAPASVAPVPSVPTNLTATAMGVSKVTRALAAQPVTLGVDRARVSLTPGPTAVDDAPSAQALFATSSASRRLYLVLGGISAPSDAAATYNVFLDLPDAASSPGPDDSHYVGTLHFFGAAGHDQHDPSSHRVVFNVTARVKALMAKGALTATPTVTLIRRGDAESASPTVGQVLLVES
jgi:hypothetical protein